MKAVSSWARASQEKHCVVLESALEEKGLELLALPGLVAKCSTLRKEVIRLRHSVKTFGRGRREVVMHTQSVGDLAPHFMEIRADAETLRKWEMNLQVRFGRKLCWLEWILLGKKLYQKSWIVSNRRCLLGRQSCERRELLLECPQYCQPCKKKSRMM